MEQSSIFDFLYDKYECKKRLKTIELFAGYGSQNLALKYLGANYEHHRICEWATKSIQAYNDIHIQDYTDYSKPLELEEVIDFLFNKGISMNYNEPMTYEQIKRKGEKWCRNTYNNIIATRNLVNIQKAKAIDLDITETETYDYLMTYSFPCQDLSLSGSRKLMAKGSGTRSGMLWEVERLLEECVELKKQGKGNLPTFLLMENVSAVIGKGAINDFQAWVTKLESLGYSNYVQILNAKDFGIPQNRERCFMVSILGEYNYKMPSGRPLEYRLKHFLEHNVDESYYLSESMIKYILNRTPLGEKGNFANNLIGNDLVRNAGTITTTDSGSGSSVRGSDNLIVDNMTQEEIDKYIYLKIPEATKKGYAEAFEGDSVCFEQPNSTTRRGRVGKGIAQTLMTSCQQGVVVSDETIRIANLRIRKLTEKECWRLQGVKNEDYENARKNQSKSSLYHLAGDSICTVCLMGLFGELLGIDYQTKITELIEQLKE